MQLNAGDLIEQIKYDECNFFACAMTYLQAIGVNASIQQLREKGIELKGYIFIVGHPITGRILSKTDFDIDGTDIKIVNFMDAYKKKFMHPIRGRVLALRQSKKHILCDSVYIVSTVIDYRWYQILYSYKSEKKLCYIVIDDGGGSYANPFKDFLQYELYQRKKNLINVTKVIIKTTIWSLYNNLLRHCLKKNDSYIDNRIFNNLKKNKLCPNEKIVPYYRNQFKKQGEKINTEILSLCENSVLFNTQCLVENKMIEGEIDARLYQRSISIIKELELKVVLKPHPREVNIEKYESIGATLIPANVTQEALLANLDNLPKCIISIFSSTLLNAKGLFNIPVISLAKILLKEDINKVFRSQLQDFILQYEDLFWFPESMDELKKMVSTLV